MKKFEILRYLKRFSILIFLVALAGAAAIYLYADGRQMYTASVIIRYTNDGISDGYTPDGSELDVNEILSLLHGHFASHGCAGRFRAAEHRPVPTFR